MLLRIFHVLLDPVGYGDRYVDTEKLKLHFTSLHITLLKLEASRTSAIFIVTATIDTRTHTDVASVGLQHTLIQNVQHSTTGWGR